MRTPGSAWGLLLCFNLVACSVEPPRVPPEALPADPPPVSEGEPPSSAAPPEAPTVPPVAEAPPVSSPVPEAPSQPAPPPVATPQNTCGKYGSTPFCGNQPCPPDVLMPGWCWQPLYHHTFLAGYGPGAEDFVVSEIQYPSDWGFVSPYSQGGVYRVDAKEPARTPSLHRATYFVPRKVFHRRYAIANWLADSSMATWPVGVRPVGVVMLDGSRPVRTLDVMAALAQQLAEAGVSGQPQAPAWVQGVAGHALLVTPIAPETVWVSDLDLDSLTLTWGHTVAGFLRGTPIADESGQLYLPLGSASGPDTQPQRLVALSATGEERWSQTGTAAPKAVFAGTLYMDDGAVRSTVDGAQLHTWPAAGASVLLSDTRAVAVAREASGSRVTLMDRQTGAVLAARVLRWTRPELVMLTDAGSVLVLESVSHPERSDSPFAIQGGLRFWLGQPGEADGSWELLGEYYPFVGDGIVEALLVEGTVVARWQDSMHNNPEPDSRYLGFRWPRLRPPAHGWLMPTGGSLGAFSPR